jgi:VWFA-related protein
VVVLAVGSASAQVFTIGGANSSSTVSAMATDGIGVSVLGTNDVLFNGINHSPLENPNVALSKLDLKAPSKAQHEYNKGYSLLLKKDMADAVQHLSAATSLYPDYVAAHNALGSAYMGLGKNDQARSEFSAAASLDDHLPNAFLNRGCAELALKDYGAAEQDIAKASTLAPLDLQVETALAYSQYMNHDYAAAVATARQVHQRKHREAAMVHLYSAVSWEAEGKHPEAKSELELLLKEDPHSPAAASAHDMMNQINNEILHPPVKVTNTLTFAPVMVRIQIPQDDDAVAQKKAQETKEAKQLAEVETDPTLNVPSLELASPSGPSKPAPTEAASTTDGYTFRSSTEEVALLFAATDRGLSAPDLTLNDVKLLDNHKKPAAITGFRNEDKLPLRLGLLIDTSDSIKDRFKFEQAAAKDFLKNVMTHDADLAFVVGFANTVLMVRDFTNDHDDISSGIDQLVPAGGTSLWNAVAFASDRLSERSETQPVARILVVISDGEDNSSSATAKQAIQHAQSGDVTVYTISTREVTDKSDDSFVGEHALRTLAELTGGDAFTPGSVKSMSSSLKELEQVIRSRYLISYKPADFKRDGQYRPIELSVEKNGRTLRVFSRKGYVASTDSSSDPY